MPALAATCRHTSDSCTPNVDVIDLQLFDLKTYLRRRRAGDEALDAEVLRLIVDDPGGGEPEPSAGAERHSPRTREALAAMFAERRPTRNMCVPPSPVPTLLPLCSMIMQESC